MTINKAAERLRASIDERIAKLNPGQGMARDRRHYTDWCRIHLQRVRDEAMDALAAAKAEGYGEGWAARADEYGDEDWGAAWDKAKAEGWEEGYNAGYRDGIKIERESITHQIERDKAKAEGARETVGRSGPLASDPRYYELMRR